MGKINMNRGTTYTIDVVYRRNSVASSLVGATVRFTVKSDEFDDSTTDSTALISKNIINGTNEGTATIVIDPADTAALTPGEYFYDIKIAESSGEVYKVDEGKFKLDGSPTNRL